MNVIAEIGAVVMRSAFFAMVTFLCAAMLTCFCGIPAAYANASKVALVIGNARYKSAPVLLNPENDAQDMAEALAEIGFDVTIKLDADMSTLNDALSDFTQKSEAADIAIVYYAGHGIELDGRNYLIPTDAGLEKESQIRYKALELDLFESAVSGARKLRVVFLDACRNNPFAERIVTRGGKSRSLVGRGLASVEPAGGTVIAFAAKGGTTASDGDGRNSPYTKALLRHIREPDLDVNMLLRRVRDEVKRDTNNQQEPYDYGSLPAETISLNPSGSRATTVDAGASTAVPAGTPSAQTNDAREAWDAVKDNKSRSDLETIVRLFPGTIYATLAQGRLQAMASEPQNQHDPQQVVATQASDGVTRTTDIAPTMPQNWYLAVYPNVDFFGGDLMPQGIKTETVDQCAGVCGGNLACRMFTYNARAKICFLKSGYDLVQRADNVVGGLFYKGTKEEPKLVQIDWEFVASADIVAQDIGTTSDGDYLSCFNSCRNHPQCTGLSFVGKVKRNKCWLKTGFSNVIGKKGVMSARRFASGGQMVSPYLVVPSNPKD